MEVVEAMGHQGHAENGNHRCCHISVCEVRMTMHGLTRFYIYLPGRIGKEACDQHRMMFAVHFHDGYVRRSPCDHARSLQAEYAAEGILAKL